MNKIILKLILILVLSYISTNTYSQDLKIDLSVGGYFSDPRIHYPNENHKEDDLNDGRGTFYTIALTQRMHKNFWLRTELGFLTTNVFLSLVYNNDVGLGENHNLLISWLNNQKVYLSILPEYYKSFEDFDFHINAGFVLSRDIKNLFVTYNQESLTTSIPVGLSLNSGIDIKLGNINIRLNLGVTSFGKSQLLSRYHPSISYINYGASLSLVYTINSKKMLEKNALQL